MPLNVYIDVKTYALNRHDMEIHALSKILILSNWFNIHDIDTRELFKSLHETYFSNSCSININEYDNILSELLGNLGPDHRHDIENGELRVYLIGWIDDLDPDNMQYDTSKDLGKFFDYLEAMSEKHNGINLHAYNLDYAIKALLPRYFQQLRYKKHVTKHEYKLSADANKFISWKFSAKKVGNQKCCLKITGIDLWVWRRDMSLDAWCRELGLNPKGNIDHDKNNLTYYHQTQRFLYYSTDGSLKRSDLKSELKYLESYLLALPKIKQRIKTQQYEILKILKISARNTGHLLCGHTVAGFSEYVTKRYLEKYDSVNSHKTVRCKKDIIKLLQAGNYSNFGGFIAYNKWVLAVEGKPIEYYDVNSMHPHIMTNAVFYGPLKTEQTNKSDQVWYLIEGTFVDWIDKYSFISQSLLPKTNLSLGVFVTKELYDLAMKHTINDINVINTYYQSEDHQLTDLVRELYELQIALIKENPIAAQAINLMLNSIYVKSCQTNHLTEKFYISEKDEDWAFYKTTHVDMKKTTHVDVKKILKNASLRWTGMQIVQAARVKLVTAILSEIDQGNTFLYCDTDSLIVVADKPVKLKADKVGKKLGWWKLEGAFTSWYCLGKSKKYCLINRHTGMIKIAVTGIDRKFKDLLSDLQYSELKEIFSLENNVLVVRGKSTGRKILLPKYDQEVFETSDIELNSSLRHITHTLTAVKSKQCKWYLQLRKRCVQKN